MKKFTILAILIFPGFLFAQAALTEIKRNVFQNLNYGVNQDYMRLLNDGLENHAQNEFFTFKEWQFAKVYTNKDEVIVLDSLNYHFVDDRMFFVKDKELYFLFPNEVNFVLVNDRTFISLLNRKEDVYQYYEVLVDGELPLLKKLSTYQKKDNSHPMGITHTTNDYQTVKKEKYYYLSEKRDVIPVPKNKKNLLRVFKKNVTKTIDYARVNGLSVNTEDDLVNLFKFYNTTQ